MRVKRAAFPDPSIELSGSMSVTSANAPRFFVVNHNVWADSTRWRLRARAAPRCAGCAPSVTPAVTIVGRSPANILIVRHTSCPYYRRFISRLWEESQ